MRKRHPRTCGVRVRRVGAWGSPGFPFRPVTHFSVLWQGATAHFCAKVNIAFIHAGTGAGTGVEANVAGLNGRMKSGLDTAMLSPPQLVLSIQGPGKDLQKLRG